MEERPGGVMTIDDLPGYPRTSRSTRYEPAREGGVPGRKVGHRWRSRKQAIGRRSERGGVDKATTEGGGDGA